MCFPAVLVTYLASLAPEEEERVLTTPLSCGNGYNGCLRGVAEHRDDVVEFISALAVRNKRLGLTGSCFIVEKAFDDFVGRVGIERVTFMLRNQIRANQRARAFLETATCLTRELA